MASSLNPIDKAAKLRELVSAGKVCVFITDIAMFPFQARPMNTQFIDKEGSLWFFSARDSNKNKSIRADPRVQLIYTDNNVNEFVSLHGKAQILFDREKIEEFWTPSARMWFKGVDDPQISIIKISPEGIHFWDHGLNKMALQLTNDSANEQLENELLSESKKILDQDIKTL